MTPPWWSRASSTIRHALAVELNRPTFRLSRVCLLFLLVCHLFCSCVAFFPFSLAPLLYPRLYLTVTMHSTQQHLRGLPAAAVCTYNLQHSPPWMLLLLFIVNRLWIIYHAVLLLRHSYHPAHAFVWWAQCSTCLRFSSCTCENQFHFILRFVFISFQLRLGSQSTYNYSAVVVRLFAPDRESCVFASCCSLPLVLLQWNILHFFLRMRIVAAYFFI